jgi:hypothetical protein
MMRNPIKACFVRALAALLFLGASGAALAGPVYRVAVDTSAWSGSGYLNLTLSGLEKTDVLTATVSNFKGRFGSERFTQGQVSGDVGSVLTLAQGPSYNELLQAIDFGGMFSFDVRFELPPGVADGANFGVALVNASQTAYADGTFGDIATIALMPGSSDALWADPSHASIGEVPEPGSAALAALGLLMVGSGRLRARSTAGPATL